MADKRIIAVADVHEDFPSLEKALDYASTRNPDLVVVAGDLHLIPYTHEDMKEVSDGQQVDQEALMQRILQNLKTTDEEAKKLLEATQIPFVVVPGNYDGVNFDETFEDESVHMRTSTLGDLIVAGYGGADAFPQHILAIRPLITAYDEQELHQYMTQADPNIAVFHNPPKTLCDTMFNGNNVGSSAALAYVTKSQPGLVIAGHIHEAGPLANNPRGEAGIAKKGKTTIVNPGNVGRFGIVDPRSLTVVKEFDYGTLSEIIVDDSTGQVKNVTHYSVRNPESGALVKELATYDLQ